MPLAFNSNSHGEVAFGFYNIETDSLLLNDIFFFATDFCPAAMAVKNNQPFVTIPGHAIETHGKMGDLMGAIHGVSHDGYLGELYSKWPFPEKPDNFRQKLDGYLHQEETLTLLKKYAQPRDIKVGHIETGEVTIGDYTFSEGHFLELVSYVWRGGHPTWQGFENGNWPDYVQEMAHLYGLV